MKTKMTRLARAVVVAGLLAATPLPASMALSASAPNPVPACCSMARRVVGAGLRFEQRFISDKDYWI